MAGNTQSLLSPNSGEDMGNGMRRTNLGFGSSITTADRGFENSQRMAGIDVEQDEVNKGRQLISDQAGIQQQAGETAISGLSPFARSGQQASSLLGSLLTGRRFNSETGLVEDVSEEERRNLFQTSPGFSFRQNEARNQLEADQARRGNFLSTRGMDEMATRQSEIASGEYGNFINQLSGLASQGLNASAYQGKFGLDSAKSQSSVALKDLALGGVQASIGQRQAENEGFLENNRLNDFRNLQSNLISAKNQLSQSENSQFISPYAEQQARDYTSRIKKNIREFKGGSF